MLKPHWSDQADLDFTSALYFGFRHLMETLKPCSHLTIGKPYGVETPPAAVGTASGI
jgi:hypothetical protein